VACSIYALHHNAAVFPRPWAFEIGRWVGVERGGEATAVGMAESEKEVKERLRAWVPFSVGPRQCVAKNFAVMELMLAMARVLWSFDFCVAEGKEGRVGEGVSDMGKEMGMQMEIVGWRGIWSRLVCWAGRALRIRGPATGAAQRGRERKEEFQMVAHFTSAVEGPMIRFKRREVC
jgi:Cytochrome P450